jgi:hypothetical protein
MTRTRKITTIVIVLALIVGAGWFWKHAHAPSNEPPPVTESSSSETLSSSSVSSVCGCLDVTKKALAFYACYVKLAKGANQDPNALNDDIKVNDGGNYEYHGVCCYSAAFVSQQCLLWPKAGPPECATLVKDPLIRHFINKTNGYAKSFQDTGWSAYNTCEKKNPGGLEALKTGCPCAPADMTKALGTVTAPTQ